jgi:predicted Zn finger-like uncharacterized protein
MILTCPECTTSYDAPAELLGPTGRKVKCHKCEHIWLATPDTVADPTETFDEFNALLEEDNADSTDEFEFDDLIVRTCKPEDEPSTEGDTPNGEADDGDPETGAVVEASDFDEQFESEEQAVETPDENSSGDEAGIVDVETIATVGRAQDRKLREVDGSTFARVRRYGAIAASLIILLGGLVVFRDYVVRFAPGSARLFALTGLEVNLRGLEFRDIVYAREFEDGIPVLAVRGEIVNVTEEPVLLPEIRFSLRDSRSQEVYYWTGSAGPDLLAPSGVVPFESRLASPPAGAEEILVRFAGR